MGETLLHIDNLVTKVRLLQVENKELLLYGFQVISKLTGG